jgi:hypothetical protein
MFRANFCPSSGAQDGDFETTTFIPYSAKQQRSETLLATSTGHYTICCKKSQSCAPEDGQTFARNMLS